MFRFLIQILTIGSFLMIGKLKKQIINITKINLAKKKD